MSEYSNLLNLTANTVKVILDGGIKLTSGVNVDEEMTEESYDDICIE